MYYPLNLNFIDTISTIAVDTISGAGGGGCFPAGTLVRTDSGYRPIAKLNKGEWVLGYTMFGVIERTTIVETLVHKVGTFLDDLYFFESNKIQVFPFGVTGNHGIYNPSTKKHKLAIEFKIGDSFESLDGILVPITSITVILNEFISTPVYNLIVEPTHTYLVGTPKLWVKVHNGGGGGSKQQAPRAPVEDPNTFQSSAIVNVLEILSYGPIQGVVGGAKGVFLSDTVIQNTDDSFNFEGIEIEFRNGLPSQAVIPMFKDVTIEVSIATTVITDTGVVHDLPDDDIDAADVTILFPSGLSSANTTTGDIHGHTVTYEIFTKLTSSGTFSSFKVITITDKSVSPTEIQHRVPRPTALGKWTIKVTRISPIDSGVTFSSVISWTRLTEIRFTTLTYSNIALCGISIPAKSVGNSIPTILHHTQGRIVNIPSNYNPVTRIYSGDYWDGSFSSGYTNNPAWCVYDMITHPVYGLQKYYLQPLKLDKFSFFEAALYSDCTRWTGSTFVFEPIEDGEGGSETRFKFNYPIVTAYDPWQLIQAMASNMHALVVDINGYITCIQDRPANTTRIFNNSNVENGIFGYSSASSEMPYTVVNVTFNNNKDRWLPDTITEQAASSAIARFGFRSKNVVAFGCTNESQARREGRYHLFTELQIPEVVSFNLGLNIVDLTIGQNIKIMDNDRLDGDIIYLTGRIVSLVGTTVVVDIPITLDILNSYSCGIVAPDRASILEADIASWVPGPDPVTTFELADLLVVGNYADCEFFCF
ncbi:MAG: TipJ family phage tail tip protein, partial [Burkholderiales bacterium]